MKRYGKQLILWVVFSVVVSAAGVAMAADPPKVKGTDLVVEGAIQSILYDRVAIGGVSFEPANEMAGLPEGARIGDRVRVRYYTQNGTNYFIEIVRDGQTFSTEDAGAPGETAERPPR